MARRESPEDRRLRRWMRAVQIVGFVVFVVSLAVVFARPELYPAVFASYLLYGVAATLAVQLLRRRFAPTPPNAEADLHDRSAIERLLRGLVAMTLASRVRGRSSSTIDVVRARLHGAVATDAHAETAWRSEYDHLFGGWRVRVPVANAAYLHAEGTLGKGKEGDDVTFDGWIRPDGMSIVSVAPLTIAGLGGAIAALIGFFGVVATRGAGSFVIALAAGIFGVYWSIGWTWAFALAHERHLMILHAAFEYVDVWRPKRRGRRDPSADA